jgi:hypothetical protein
MDAWMLDCMTSGTEDSTMINEGDELARMPSMETGNLVIGREPI